jgi:uncharacterized protein
MSTTLAATALLMGLAGGPHCVAMCGAPCAGVIRMGPAPGWRQTSMFQAGRVAGYSLAGAAAALAVQSLAWFTQQAAALRPVWTLLHLMVLAWGFTLLALARQPGWVSAAGQSAWVRMRPWAGARGGIFGAGALWAFMPCGLLYSALLVASLSGGPLEGATSMALFAAGSGIWLAVAPALVLRLQQAGNHVRRDWGTRASGLLLVLAAGWSLWMDLAPRIAAWCAT